MIDDDLGANRARLVSSQNGNLHYEENTNFVFSPCLILVAGSSSNISQLIGIGMKLQLIKPLAMVLVKNTTDLIMEARLRELHTSFPLLLTDDDNNGELKLCTGS